MTFNIAISIAAGITYDVSCSVVMEIPVFYSSEPLLKLQQTMAIGMNILNDFSQSLQENFGMPH
jgi:hypothetical protein